MGPSGSGKTTLLNLIGGLDSPTEGTIAVAGRRIDQLGQSDLARWRANNVGFVFQFYNLLPMLSATRNVELPLLLTKLPAAKRRSHAAVALELVGLADRATHKPGELSGGQQQRVAIARAIVSDPTLLVCDEPTGDLDRQSAVEVLTLLQRLNREHGKTIVMVTHDPKAAEYATIHCTSIKARWSRRARRRRLRRRCHEIPAPRSGRRSSGARPGRCSRSSRSSPPSCCSACLNSVRDAFTSAGHNVAGARRMITMSKESFVVSLPTSLLMRIQAVPGVSAVTYASWFGGYFQEPKNQLVAEAVAPNYFDLYPEWVLPAAQVRAFHRTRTGAVVGQPSPSTTTGSWATRSRCRRRSSRRRTARIPGHSTWSASIT